MENIITTKSHRILVWSMLIIFFELTLISGLFNKPDNTTIGNAQKDLRTLIGYYDGQIKKSTNDSLRIELTEKLADARVELVKLSSLRKSGSHYTVPVLNIQIPNNTINIFYPAFLAAGLIYILISRQQYLKKNDLSHSSIPIWAYPVPFRFPLDNQEFYIVKQNLMIFLHMATIILFANFILRLIESGGIRAAWENQKYSELIWIFCTTGAIVIAYFVTFINRKMYTDDCHNGTT